ncbi:MAG TPA: uroporphyrinogen-III synthase [Ignavibacteriaceae bacterium]|nr:uroporphyrinogen-III synthase [Ignavibacteriaceae bacterium]
MIIKEKRQSGKILKRSKIIEAASLLFAQKNYHEVMMEDVAKLASLAKGTVYNYFSSKEELYFSIMQQRMEKLISSLKNKIADEKTSIDSLHSFIIHVYMFMMKYQTFFLMYQKESLKAENEICSELCTLERDLKNMLKSIIKSGKNENLFREIDEDFAVDLILGSVYGSVSRGIEKRYDEEEMIKDRERTYEFIVTGLFSGFDNNQLLPLKNKTIVITRMIEQSKESSEIFQKLGAEVITFPTLEIMPPDSWKDFDDIVKKQSKIDFIIFTSAHAVNMFIKRCEELSLKFDFNRIRIVAVGSKTAGICEKNNIPVHIIPKEFSGDGVIEELTEYDLEGKVIFIPRSAIGREELPDGLKKRGAKIKTASVYNIGLPSEENIVEYKEKLKKSNPDLFVFTSPSTFVNFLEIQNIADPIKYFAGYTVAVIGPTTKAALEKKKVKVDIIPKEFTLEGLVKSIVEFYQMEKN